MSGIWLLIAPVSVHSFLLLLFVVTEGCVLLCGNPKKQPRTSSIVQFVFFVWFFEISGNLLRNQDFFMFGSMYSKQVYIIWTPFGLISVFL